MRALIAVTVCVTEVIPIAWGFVVTPTYFAWGVYFPTCCKPYVIREKRILWFHFCPALSSSFDLVVLHIIAYLQPNLINWVSH